MLGGSKPISDQIGIDIKATFQSKSTRKIIGSRCDCMLPWGADAFIGSGNADHRHTLCMVSRNMANQDIPRKIDFGLMKGKSWPGKERNGLEEDPVHKSFFRTEITTPTIGEGGGTAFSNPTTILQHNNQMVRDSHSHFLRGARQVSMAIVEERHTPPWYGKDGKVCGGG